MKRISNIQIRITLILLVVLSLSKQIVLAETVVQGDGLHDDADQMEFRLWPDDKMAQLPEPEKIVERSNVQTNTNRAFFNVSNPTITVYQLASSTSPVPAVVICPGGAYGGIAIDKEGHDVARWLNTLGIAGVVLKYRVPMRGGDGKHVLPLQDVQRALSYVRSQAVEWKIDPQRVGVMGFSAGGHLSANLSNNYGVRAYEDVDDVDKFSCRPDFTILIYPAYLTPKEPIPSLYPGVNVTSNTPPTFLAHAEDDPISVENSIYYYLALRNAGVPAYMVLFPKGGHGYGMGIQGGPVADWPRQCERWLIESAIIRK